VTSQWYETSRPLFITYLKSKGIAPELDLSEYEKDYANKEQHAQSPSSRANSRYRGNPIGNAQNLFVRNILSSIGLESFNEGDWNSTKDYFSHRCAYCGNETELLIEHAIPINKEKLGEHRLGNLVPSWRCAMAIKVAKTSESFWKETQRRSAK
jgi:5-methylcytosine-specific restriction endonuclease McrA